MPSARSTDQQTIGVHLSAEGRVNYLCLTFQDEHQAFDHGMINGESHRADVLKAVDELRRAGNHIASSNGIPPATSTTVRVRNGRMVLTDGPLNASREYLAGFTIIKARDLNEAVRLAARSPLARSGSIEVHPLPELAIEPMGPALSSADGSTSGALT